MARILRRINDNRVSIPGDLLKLLDINKGDTVELIHVNNQIIIQKVENLDELNESPNTNFNSSFIDDTYKLRLSKRKEISIPKELFDKYELSGKRFNTSYEKELDENGEAKYYIIVSENGNQKFRKDNTVSFSYIFPNTEFKEGQMVSLIEHSPEELKFSLVPNKKEEQPISTLKEQMLDANRNIFKEEKQENEIEESILNFKAKIGQRYIITIPIKVFSKIEQYGLKFDYILKEDKDTNELKLLIVFNEYGNTSLQKSGAMTLKTLMDPIEPIIGEEIYGEYDIVNKALSLVFPKNTINIPEEQELTQEIKEEKVNEVKIEDNTVDEPKEDKIEPIQEKTPITQSFVDKGFIKKPKDEIEDTQDMDEMIKDESLDIKEQYYRQQIEEFKAKDIAFRFIDKTQLPKQKLCFKCGNNLSSTDNSMIKGHRICNKCKHNYLKKLFTPIKELSKIREERK